MNIPILKRIEVQDLIPFDPIGCLAEINQPIAIFQKDDSKGKTTFFQAIELSLFRDSTGSSYNSIRTKKHSQENITFIKGTWDINGVDYEIKQELTERGIHSYFNNNLINKDNFNNRIQELIDLPLEIERIHELYNLLVFYPESIEVQNRKYSLITNWETFLNDFLPLIISNLDDQEFLCNYSELKNLLRKKENEIELKQNQLERTKQINDDYDNTILLMKERMEQNLEKCKKEEERIKRRLAKTEDYKNRIIKMNDVLRLFYEYHRNEETKSSLKNEIELYEDLENQEIITRTFMEELSVAQQKRRFEQDYFSYCPICHYGIIKNWEKNMHRRNCPVCKLDYEFMPKHVKERLLASEDLEEVINREREIHETNLEELQEQVKYLTEINNELERRIESSFIEIDLKNVLEEERLKEVENRIEKINNIVNNRIQELKGNLDSYLRLKKNYENDLGEYDDLISRYENLENIEIIEDELRILSVERREIQTQMEELMDRKTEIDENISNLKTELYQFISEQTDNLLHYRFRYDFNNKSVILDNGTSKPIESSSEFNFMEFCLRVLVWKFLIQNNYTEKGFMVLDNPNKILDNNNSQKFKSIVETTNEELNYIITTQDEFIGENIEQIDFRTTQRSIMEYLNP